MAPAKERPATKTIATNREARHVLPALLYPKVAAYPTITSTFFPLKATPYL